MQLVNIIKPTHRCNLACKYCYNEDIRNPIMSLDTLEKSIYGTFDYFKRMNCFSQVHFIWHGGEPMLAGIDFYQKVIEFQKIFSKGISYINAIQTNGTLINNRWCEFFKKEGFFVSVSIDGPGICNDINRVYKNGKGSFDKILKGIKTLKNNGLEVGCALVISKSNKDYVEDIYYFMVKNNLPFNVIPLNKSGSAIANYEDIGISPNEYYEAWSKLYDKWFNATSDEYIYVSDFVRKTQAIIVGRAADCIGMAQCGNTNFSIDPVGDVYPCASLSSHTNLRYGNINRESLYHLMLSDVAKSYRTRESFYTCKSCKWIHVCHGGCPARTYKFHGNNLNMKDYYCDGLFKMYEHISKRLREKGIEPGSPYLDHMSDGLIGTNAYLKYKSNQIDVVYV